MAYVGKTGGITLLSWQDVATASTVISSPQDVSTKLGAVVFGKIARRSGTAFTSGWPAVRVEASAVSSGDGAWYPIFTYVTNVGTAIANTTLSATVATGAQSFTVASSSNITAGDLVYLGDTSSANWELVRVRSVSGNVVTPEQATLKDHNSGASVTDQAEMIAAVLDLVSVLRVRVVVDAASSGQTCAVEFMMSTGDSIG